MKGKAHCTYKTIKEQKQTFLKSKQRMLSGLRSQPVKIYILIHFGLIQMHHMHTHIHTVR